MTHLQLNQELLATLKDKVVVLTGGATGIGRATVEQFNSKANPMSAYLNIRLIPYREWSPGRLGDVNDGVAHQGASKLGAGAYFVHCDTSYSDQLTLFTTAEKVFHRVDIVVANASIAHHKDIFAPDQDVSREPSMAEIDVNTKGTLFTTRIGILYLRKYGGGDIVLVSSIAVFKESGGVATYTASKHGVIGLMRGLHLTASPENIRINVVCPWMTSKSSSPPTVSPRLTLPRKLVGERDRGRLVPAQPADK